VVQKRYEKRVSTKRFVNRLKHLKSVLKCFKVS